MPPIVCLGVDPAPSARGSWIAEFHVTDRGIEPQDKPKRLRHSQLREDLKTRNEACILLAWDAPLTGPNRVETAGDYPFDFTARPIERAFNCKTRKKLPDGISVQGYAGCQHWTITRNVLGLPRVGPFDAEGTPPLPFVLIAEFPAKERPPKMVVEVHPALAIWLWVGKQADAQKIDLPNLRYKKTRNVKIAVTREARTNIINLLVSRWRAMGLSFVADAAVECHELLVKHDDALDAYVSGVLAALLASGKKDVRIFGNQHLGMFLLPTDQIIDDLTNEKIAEWRAKP